MIALALTLMAFAGTSSPRHPTSGSEHAILVDAPDTTNTVDYGGITVGLAHTGFKIVNTPKGPRLVPDIAVNVGPPKAVDKLAVPLVKGLTNGSGKVSTRLPNLDVGSIELNLGAEGTVTVTLRSKESNLSLPSSGG